jgi:hypothetical protein
VTVLIDSGPIVALLNRRDQHHDWCPASAAEVNPPMHTCEAVLTEAHRVVPALLVFVGPP